MDTQLYLLDRQIRIFGASIAYLAKVGRDIVLEVDPDKVRSPCHVLLRI